MDQKSVMMRRATSYKAPSGTFGRINSKEGVEKRRLENIMERKHKKEAAMMKYRNIDNKTEEKGKKMIDNKPSRLEKLLDWKKQREDNKKKTDKNKKPPFVLGTSSGIPELKDLLAPIQIKSKKFKPPINLKAIDINIKSGNRQTGPITRSQARQNITIFTQKKPDLARQKVPIVSVISTNVKQKLTQQKNIDFCTVAEVRNKALPNKKTKPVLRNKPGTSKTAKSKPSEDLVPIKTSPQTPKASPNLVPTYTSPFVTISRGKNNAIKEYKQRMSSGGPLEDPNNSKLSTHPEAAAAHFGKMLADQIVLFHQKCNYWRDYIHKNNSPEEVVDMINVPLGQTQLLIDKKFAKFSKLINFCELRSEECPVKCLDLHGFWDLLTIEIDNINKRFDNLQRICDNNWKEILPSPTKAKPKAKAQPKKKVQSSSTLRDAIKAARAKKVQSLANDNVIAIISTPSGKFKEYKKEINECSTPQVKRVLRENILPRRHSSPGLVMMKASNSAKVLETRMNENTPCSILRTAATSARKHKFVAFRDPLASLQHPPLKILKFD